MSIKGIKKELYVGKTGINIITSAGKRTSVSYDEMEKIEYCFASSHQNGFINFVTVYGSTENFNFSTVANDPIQRTIVFINEHASTVETIERLQKETAKQSLTKQCKFCKSDIPYTAKVCPYCTRKQGINKITVALCVIIILGICRTALDKNNTINANENIHENQVTKAATATAQNESSSAQEIPADKEETNVFYDGDVFESNKVKIMHMGSGDYTSDNILIEPADGTKFVYVDLSILNVDDSDLSTGSFDFDCYADDSLCSQAFVTADDQMVSIATVSPNKYLEGKIYFEVPETAKKIEVEYETSFWTEEKIYFVIE